MSKKSKEEITKNRIKMGVKISSREARNISYNKSFDEEIEKEMLKNESLKKPNINDQFEGDEFWSP